MLLVVAALVVVLADELCWLSACSSRLAVMRIRSSGSPLSVKVTMVVAVLAESILVFMVADESVEMERLLLTAVVVGAMTGAGLSSVNGWSVVAQGTGAWRLRPDRYTLEDLKWNRRNALEAVASRSLLEDELP